MPTDLPISAFGGVGVQPDLGVAFARSEGGLVVTSRRADPFWRGRLTTGPLSVTGADSQYQDFLAWLTWAADLNMRVDFVHPRQRFPRSYTAETWPMIGDATLEAVTDLRSIDVSGLTVGLVLKRGDRLSIAQGDIICHRWIATDLVVASAISQALPLTPRLPIGVLAAGATVALEDAKLRFMVVPGSWADSEEQHRPTPVGFEISEALR